MTKAATRIDRESELRVNEMRNTYDMYYLSPFIIPSEVKKEGYSYAFVSFQIRGEATYKVEQKIRQGWTPVPSSRCTSYITDPLKRSAYSQEFITYMDTLLMERPEQYSRFDNERLTYLTTNSLKSLRGVTTEMLGSTITSGLRSLNSF